MKPINIYQPSLGQEELDAIRRGEITQPTGQFAADGGMIGGGIMDAAGRQQYFLGKLVKKATRAVKKVVKSPIGKAALLYGLGSYGLGKGLFGGMKGAGFLKGNLMKNADVENLCKSKGLWKKNFGIK